MNKEFVPSQQSLEIKELGFDEPCLAHLIGFGDGTKENGLYKINQQQVFYPNDYTSSDDKAEELGLHPFGMCGVPLYQQAFRWFREKHKLRNTITDFIDDETGIEWDYEIAIIGTDLDEKGNYKPLVAYSTDDETRKFKTYEEAELACLKELIEIVKQKQ